MKKVVDSITDSKLLSSCILCGCRKIWLIRVAWDHETARSNRVTRTSLKSRIDFVDTMAALSDFGTTLVVVVVQELPFVESKPMGSLGWFAKPSVLFRV